VLPRSATVELKAVFHQWTDAPPGCYGAMTMYVLTGDEGFVDARLDVMYQPAGSISRPGTPRYREIKHRTGSSALFDHGEHS
jgi:hypothetical protein